MDLRIARTLFATDVVALSTLRSISDEQGVANVTIAANTLADGPADEVLPTGSGRDGENDLLTLGSLGVGLDLGLSGFGTILGLRRRIAEALLAAKMVAAGADLVDAQAGETAMAIATNTHADRLVDTLDIVADGADDPFVGPQGQAVLLKESTGAVLPAPPFL